MAKDATSVNSVDSTHVNTIVNTNVNTITMATVVGDVETEGRSSRAPRPEKLLGVRHLQTLLLFLCLTVAYTLRVNLSVAIVAMVTPQGPNPDIPVYEWDDKIKSTILSSFFWGYVLTQVPAGQLAEKFGPKMLLVISLGVASTFTLLTPLFAAWGGWQLVCVTRVIQGLSQGFIFPCVHTLLAKWAPTEERGRLATYSYAGAQFGTVLALPISGLLASSAAGWPACFYLFGAFGLGWALLWFFLGANSPAEHASISKEERAYIEESLGTISKTDEKRITPWLAIFMSIPLLSLIIVHCAQNWGFWTLLTEMPTYMNDVLEFDLKANGFLSALPYLVMWLLSFVFSWLSDLINKKKLISLATSRKIFNTIAHWGPAVALIGVGYTNKENPYVAVGLLTVSVGLNAGTYVGFQVNHIDLSPNFAGTLMGITNGFANIMSIVGPLVVGVIVTEQGNVYQWRTVFFIAAGIYFVGNLVFIIFGKAEIQRWNEVHYRPRKVKPKPSDTDYHTFTMSDRSS